MDSAQRKILPEVAGPTRPGTHRVRPSGRRRRPSGEAPPLPHHLQTSGVGSLVALVVLVALSIMIFAGGFRGPAVAVTVLDDAAVRWLAGLGRVALGAEAPTDVLVGAAIGVTIPLVLFRLFAPNETFPIRYRRGRSAHLDVGGARGEAIRRGLEDQLGSRWPRSRRSGWPARPARSRCGSRSRATRPGSCSASCTPAATCGPTAGTSSPASAPADRSLTNRQPAGGPRTVSTNRVSREPLALHASARDEPADLSDSDLRSHQHCSPAGATCC
jgi:hypothetical protein